MMGEEFDWREAESEYKVSLHEEVCCTDCNKVVHNHFDCPACDTDRAATSRYAEMRTGVVFNCHECSAEFGVVDVSGPKIHIDRIVQETYPEVMES